MGLPFNDTYLVGTIYNMQPSEIPHGEHEHSIEEQLSMSRVLAE